MERSTDANEMLQRTKELHKQGDWKGILDEKDFLVKIAEQLTVASPDHAYYIYSTLGMAHHAVAESRVYLVEHSLAVEMFEACIKITGVSSNLSIEFDFSIRSRLATCLYSIGEYQKCIDTTKKAQTICNRMKKALTETVPMNLELDIAIAQCSLELQKYEAARQYFSAAMHRALQNVQHQTPRKHDMCMQQIHTGLGDCQKALGNYSDAFEAYAAAHEVCMASADLPGLCMIAALNIGTVLWAQARVEHQHAGFIFQRHIKCARQWLLRALNCKSESPDHIIETEAALLMSAFVAFDSGDVAESLTYLRHYLQLQIQTAGSVCRGCAMLKNKCAVVFLRCSGCKVARFCNPAHQRMASQQVGNLPKQVWHKDVCMLLQQWRDVNKGRVTVQSCTLSHMTFLESDVWWARQNMVAPSRARLGLELGGERQSA